MRRIFRSKSSRGALHIGEGSSSAPIGSSAEPEVEGPVHMEEETDSCFRSPPRAELSRPEPRRGTFPNLDQRGNAKLDIFVTGEEDEDWCDFRFVSKKAHMAYQRPWGNTTNVNVEREFPDDDLPEALKMVFNKNKMKYWNRLITKKGASSELVKEIMANMKNFDTDEGAAINDPRVVYCRKRWLIITPRVIGEVMKIPPLTVPCAFENAMRKDKAALKAEVEMYCFEPGETPVWSGRGDLRYHRCRPRQLRKEVKWVTEVIYSWVWGLTPPTEVSFETLVMAMCLMRGLRVDIPKRIYLSLGYRVWTEGSPRALGHAYLLLAIAQKFEVHVSSREHDLVPGGKTGARFWKNVQRRAAPPQASEPSHAAAQDEQGPSQTDPTETAHVETAPSAPTSSQHQSGELSLVQAIQALTAEVARTNQQMVANQEENVFCFGRIRDGVNRIGMQTQRLGQYAGEWGVHRGYEWVTMDAPGEWIYEPVDFDRPQVHAHDRGHDAAGPSTHMEGAEDSDEAD